MIGIKRGIKHWIFLYETESGRTAVEIKYNPEERLYETTYTTLDGVFKYWFNSKKGASLLKELLKQTGCKNIS